MINNPELIKKIIDQIQNVPLEILDEAINEVKEENLYCDRIKKFTQIQYEEKSFYIDILYNNFFEFLHTNWTSNSFINKSLKNNKKNKMEIGDAA